MSRLTDLNHVVRAAISLGILVVCSGPSELRAEHLSSPAASAAHNPKIDEAMGHLEPLWESMRSDVVSCQAKFRIFFQVTPETPLTRKQIREMLSRYDLGRHIELAPKFLQEVAGGSPLFVPPTRNHFEHGPQIRHDLGRYSYFHVNDFSFISDGDNKHIHVHDRGRTSSDAPSPSLFRLSLNSRTEGHIPTAVERQGDQVLLTCVEPSEHGSIVTRSQIDWATGVPLRLEYELNADLVQDVEFASLTTFAGGITFPRCTWTIRYSKGVVLSLDLALLDEAKFNEPIPASTFLVAKPKDWHVLDFRGQANGTSIPTPAEAAPDVRVLIPKVAQLTPVVVATDPPSLRTPMRILLLMNGLFLIAAGVWLWKRLSLKEPKH